MTPMAEAKQTAPMTMKKRIDAVIVANSSHTLCVVQRSFSIGVSYAEWLILGE